MAVDDPRTTLPTQALPWPEPWHYSRGARPRSEFWDAASAGWHSRGPVVPPREQDRAPHAGSRPAAPTSSDHPGRRWAAGFGGQSSAMANLQTEDGTTAVAAAPRPRRPHALSEYWDHRTATWQVTNPIPTPRRG
jgi:hypothetical protein